MYRFPENLYSDVRINENCYTYYIVQDGEIRNDSFCDEAGAIIRVFDGKMWYTSVTNELDTIQQELDSLASLAEPNPEIYENPEIKLLEANRDSVYKYDGDNDIRKVPRDDKKQLVDGYIATCAKDLIPEIKSWYAFYRDYHSINKFYSSKGADIEYDCQSASLGMSFAIVIDGVTTNGGKNFRKMTFPELRGHESEIISERERYIDYAKNAVDIVPGDYACVLSPMVNAMFTHESFGHKSEADFMFNDKTLRDEWVMGKKLGNEKVSICDRGDLTNNGYTPYDDEGTKARQTWLIKDGVLTGRLHNAHSAAILGEKLTGSCRAESYGCQPIVRMTNTYMEKGSDKFEDMIAGVKDGFYIYSVSYGTGNSTFTMAPACSYRIREGKICEPVRVNVITGSVFSTLFDIDAVGDDFELFDTYTCGKKGQSVPVSAGGSSIRVKKLNLS